MKAVVWQACLIIWLAVVAAAGSSSGQDEAALKPISPLSKDKIANVESLSERVREQQRNLGSLPDSAEIIRMDTELSKFCSAFDLVAITFSEDDELSRAAFGLLRDSFNAAVTAGDVADLLKHFQKPTADEAWKAGWGKQAYDRLEALAKAIQYDGGTMAKLLARLKESQETVF